MRDVVSREASADLSIFPWALAVPRVNPALRQGTSSLVTLEQLSRGMRCFATYAVV